MTIPDPLRRPLVELLLAAADDALMLGTRNSDWTGLGPMLEEDIAFSAFAQDEVAHAQALYELIASIDADHGGRSADELAFGRDPADYRCAAITVASDDFDWATALARLLYCTHFSLRRFQRMARSSFEPLASLARRLGAEQRLVVDHVDRWIVRLGKGTEESRERIRLALDALMPLAAMLPEPVEGEADLVEAGLYPETEPVMAEQWRDDVDRVAGDAGLRLAVDAPHAGRTGGRRGDHGPELAELLDEMCEVYRSDPGAAW